MEGDSLTNPISKGLIPRMIEYLISKLREADASLEFSIKCSYMEIYMAKIMDLLDVKTTNQ